VYDQSAGSWENRTKIPGWRQQPQAGIGMAGTRRRSRLSARDRAGWSEMELFLFGASEYCPFWIMGCCGEHDFFPLDVSACLIWLVLLTGRVILGHLFVANTVLFPSSESGPTTFILLT